jgi:hypothetical protein
VDRRRQGRRLRGLAQFTAGRDVRTVDALSPSFRLRLTALLPILLAGGCTSTALEIELDLNDSLFPLVDTARIVVHRSDNTSFPMATTTTPLAGLSVHNGDADGDGVVDVLFDFEPGYPLAKTTRVDLVPSSLDNGSIPVTVRAEIFDALKNRLAISDPATTSLTPGEVTHAKLTPACANLTACAVPTVNVGGDPNKFSVVGINFGASVSSLAAGNLTNGPLHRSDLAVGSALAATATDAGVSDNGQVRVFLSPLDPNNPVSSTTIVGALAGDQLGAALATADLDGDGTDDLVLGAPGTGGGAGTIYGLLGNSSWWNHSLILLANPPGDVRLVRFGGMPGDRLGSALAVATVGKNVTLIGSAPGHGAGAGAIYAIPGGRFMPTSPDGGTPGAALVSGLPGSGFGTALAALDNLVAVGAPLENGSSSTVGAVYLFDAATELNSSIDITPGRARWTGQGGGFGSAVALADVDGSGSPSVIVAAPTDGAGVVSLRSSADLFGSADVTGAPHLVTAESGVSLFGAAIAHVPQGAGDAVIIGAPYRLPYDPPGTDGGIMMPTTDAGAGSSTDPSAGAAYVLRGPTLTVLPSLLLHADGRPAAAAAFGAQSGDGFGSILAVGNFYAETGHLAVAIAASRGQTISIVRDFF